MVLSRYWTQSALVACWCLSPCTIETLMLFTVFDKERSLWHHKKLWKSQVEPGTWEKAQVEPVKYTSNCREKQAGTITSYCWEKTVLKQGFELGIYFPAIAGNGPSYSTLYYQASKCFYHSVQYLLYMLCPFILNQLPFFLLHRNTIPRTDPPGSRIKQLGNGH